MQTPGEDRRTTLWLAITLAVTALVYWPGMNNEFPFDDGHIVQSSVEGRPNPMVAELQPIGAYFTTEYWQGAGSDRFDSIPLYRPVTILSYALTHHVWPGDGGPSSEAFPHRLLNLLLHLGNTLLVFVLLRYVLRRFTQVTDRGPLLGAAVFGIAAIHTEAVVAIVGRADLFAFGFGIGAVLLGLRARDACGPKCLALGGSAALAMFGALCSKESAVAIGPLLACFVLVTDMGTWRRGVWISLAIGLPAVAVWAWLRATTLAPLPDPQPVAYVSNPLAHVDTGSRILAGIAVQGHSLWSMIWPWPLACDYGAGVFRFAGHEPDWDARSVAHMGLAMGALASCGFALARRRPLLFLTTATFAGLAALTSNVIFPIGTIHGERLAYLPSLALAVGVATLVVQIGGGTRWLLIGVLAWCAANAAIVAVRAPEWKDNATLFRADVQRQPGSLFLRLNAAIVEQRAGNWSGWREHLEAGLRHEPDWARGRIELAAGRVAHARATAPRAEPARSQFLQRELAAAEAMLRQAQKATIVEPSEQRMLTLNLGSVLVQRGQTDAAHAIYRDLLAKRPLDVDTRHAILINAAAGMTDRHFLEFLEEGERRQPDEALWTMHRGLRAARLERLDDARLLLRRALPRVTKVDGCVGRARQILSMLREK